MLHSLASPAARRRPIRFLHRILRLQDLFRQRSTLARLDDHLLRDIGLTPEDAHHEAARSVWDVPAHWRE